MVNPRLRSQSEVVEAFDRMVQLRDGVDRHSAAYALLNQRIHTLGWALNHPLVDEIIPSEEHLLLLSCVS